MPFYDKARSEVVEAARATLLEGTIQRECFEYFFENGLPHVEEGMWTKAIKDPLFAEHVFAVVDSHVGAGGL